MVFLITLLFAVPIAWVGFAPCVGFAGALALAAVLGPLASLAVASVVARSPIRIDYSKLLPGEEVLLSTRANHWVGGKFPEGFLLLTTGRLLFQTHWALPEARDLVLDLRQVLSSSTRRLPVAPWRGVLRVSTTGGATHRFFVSKPLAWSRSFSRPAA